MQHGNLIASAVFVTFILFPVTAYAQVRREMNMSRITFNGGVYTEHAPISLPADASLFHAWNIIEINGNFFIAPQGAKLGTIHKISLDHDQNGTLHPYGEDFRDDIAIARCVRSEKIEYATIPTSLAPHVLRFTPADKRLSPGFFAGTMKPYARFGITCADSNGDGADEIVVGERRGGVMVIKYYDAEIGKVQKEFIVPGWGFDDFHLSKIDLGGDGRDELLIGAGGLMQPVMYLYRADGTLMNKFAAFPEGFTGGVNVSGADIDGDGKEEIVAGAGAGGGQLRVLDGFGVEKMTNRFFPFGDNFRGGVIPLITTPTVGANSIRPPRAINDRPYVIALAASLPIGDTTKPKSIVINTDTQRLQTLSYGHAFASFPISTGKWNFATPLGNHAVTNKIKRAYSRRYGLYMPWWMAIVPGGAYGIHELPEWPNGTKEGESHLGTPRSHGCIRLGVGPAKLVYDWTETGTQVVVK